MRSGWVKGALVAGTAAASLGLGACDKLYGAKSAAPPANSLEEMIRQAQAAQQQQPQTPPADPAAMQAFLRQNAQAPGVQTTPSGLQYKILHSGPTNVPTLADGDAVKVNYEGTLIDGTVFDTAAAHGGPQDMTVGELVPGFNEALKMMRPGDSWMIYLPPQLGYGDHPQPGSPIPAGAVLIFKLEVVSKAGGNTANG
jgi:FKBP-type peptidyl-prolyl cis-trans isomerase FklB